MHFLVDESTGYGVARQLMLMDHDVAVVADIMPEAEDVDILAYAFVEQRIVVTNDKDFGDLIFRSQQPHHGVLLLRLQDESADNRVRIMGCVIT